MADGQEFATGGLIRAEDVLPLPERNCWWWLPDCLPRRDDVRFELRRLDELPSTEAIRDALVRINIRRNPNG